MRLVSLYAKLMNGEVVKKDEEAAHFGVDKRTIQRDIENLRDCVYWPSRRFVCVLIFALSAAKALNRAK